MKLIAVALLVFGMLCSSVVATAEGPIPFNKLMQTAGAQPSIPPKDQSTTVSTQPSQRPPMTTGGKIMTGTGVSLFVIGCVGLIGTAIIVRTDSGKAYGASAGAIAGGVTLVILGDHQRSAK